MRLILGNKNYSSWSMRAGVAAIAFDIPVETETLWLDESDALATKMEFSPAGRVPILRDGELTIWDSLAICEYWAERFPDRGLWPSDPPERARARSLVAEMHSGFATLRTVMPLNIRLTKATPSMDEDLRKDLERIQDIFADAQGPYLLGRRFTLADAFYAPVASRLVTYQIDLRPAAATYVDTILRHPAVMKWIEGARAEERRMPHYDG